MRMAFFAILATTLTPVAAQAGDGFSIPPSGVLAPPKAVASLYDSDTLTSGRPIAPAGKIEVRPLPDAPAAPAAKPKRKPISSLMRPALRPYVRHSHKPPATLPPAEAVAELQPAAPVISVPPAQTAPAPVAYYAPPAAAPPSGRFSNLFSPGRSRSGERGLFTAKP